MKVKRIDIDALAVPPALLDVSLIKAHMRIDSDESDALLNFYTAAAIKWAENTTHRNVIARAVRWVIDGFPYHPEIMLPRGKTQSIASIKYSTGGSIVTLTGPSSGSPPGVDYQEDLRGDSGGVVLPAYGGAWPSVDVYAPAPVEIEFTAGWLQAEIPADLLHAALFFVADCFELRGTPDFNPAMLAGGGPTFRAREALISSYRLWQWR